MQPDDSSGDDADIDRRHFFSKRPDQADLPFRRNRFERPFESAGAADLDDEVDIPAPVSSRTRTCQFGVVP